MHPAPLMTNGESLSSMLKMTSSRTVQRSIWQWVCLAPVAGTADGSPPFKEGSTLPGAHFLWTLAYRGNGELGAFTLVMGSKMRARGSGIPYAQLYEKWRVD